MTFGQRSGYWLAYGIIYSISLLPLWVLYRFSDLLFLIVYHVIGYRKAVVHSNLKRVFSEKSEDEIRQISRKFYRHLCDLVVETVKAFSMSDEQLARRVFMADESAAEEVMKSDKGALVLGTHYGNNEWMCSRLDLMISRRYRSFAVFNPFSSKVFDRMMMNMRTRRGLEFVPMRKAMSQAVRKLSETCMFGFITDQMPRWGQGYYYTSFFGTPTAWFTSVSKIALRTGANVYFADMVKVGRGKYRLNLIRLDTAGYLPETTASIHRFTDDQVELLEKRISAEPAYWLWSHRRWKRPPKPGDQFSDKLSEISFSEADRAD